MPLAFGTLYLENSLSSWVGLHPRPRLVLILGVQLCTLIDSSGNCQLLHQFDHHQRLQFICGHLAMHSIVE
jgi:hypothetical protein